MGILGEFFREVLADATDKTRKMNADYENYRERYDRTDDQQLIRQYKNASGVKKMAMASLLRERGYGKKDE